MLILRSSAFIPALAKISIYDYLIIATGARHSYFGKDHWEKFAPGIKNIDDAIDMRRKILLAFEKAEMESDPKKRAALLTFVVVGAGPTGVELAGALAELAYNALMDDFTHIHPGDAKIYLLDAASEILTAFPEKLTKHAHNFFDRMNVEVITDAFVTDITEEGVTYGDCFIPARTVLWCAGVQASRAYEWIDIKPVTTAGHIAVDKTCAVKGHNNIFAVGDTAYYIPEGSQTPLPGVAPVAKQQGTFVARYLSAAIEKRALPIFKYKDYGNLAMVGRHAAIADFGFFHIWGRLGWLMWAIIHIYFLISFRQRSIVAMHWLHEYITYKRGARLITKDDPLGDEK